MLEEAFPRDHSDQMSSLTDQNAGKVWLLLHMAGNEMAGRLRTDLKIGRRQISHDRRRRQLFRHTTTHGNTPSPKRSGDLGEQEGPCGSVHLFWRDEARWSN